MWRERERESKRERVRVRERKRERETRSVISLVAHLASSTFIAYRWRVAAGVEQAEQKVERVNCGERIE